MTVALNKSAAFLVGFSFAFLPSFGPFLAVLFFLASRWTFNRSDALWGAAALFSALSLGVHTGLEGFAFGMLQIMGPWLVYRAFFHLRRVPFLPANAAAVTGGLVAGLAAVVAAGWVQMGQLNFAYKTFTQAVIWSSSPAFYGHTVFVLGALIAVLTAEARFRFLGLGLSAVGILVAGSREAALAWVVVTAVLFWVRGGRSWRSWTAEIGLLCVMLVVAAGFGPLFGWGRFGFLLDLLPSAGDRNLVQGSEIPNGDWWDATWVGVEAGSAELSETPLTTYEVTKKGADSWLRLQQVVPITAGEPYTVSTWLRPEQASQPGVQGWGQLLEDKQTFTLTAALVNDRWQASATGPGRVLNAGIAAARGEWRRVFVTFVYEGEPLLYWYVGLAPDARPVANSAATFAGFQLEPGAQLSDYTPGAATKGLSLGAARVPYWQAAWQGIRAKPWLGWGPDSFPDYYRTTWPNNRKLGSLPSHVHNFFLHVLFERGVLGFLGLALLLAAVLWGTFRTRDSALLAVVLAALFINLFDVTLFYGGVLYPLVAVAGWRAATLPSAETTSPAAARQFGVSLGLAATDFLMAYSAFMAALFVLRAQDLPRLADPFSVTTYALLLWPVMVWREGLYPGYGLAPPQELRKQVVAATYAALLLAAGTVLFGQDLPVPRSVLVLTYLLSLALLVLGRSTLKRLLLRGRLWGRPVFVLGAGRSGVEVAEVLARHPLEGLRPVAFFDDDPFKQNRNVAGLPVLGTLASADDYAARWGVNHAVVAIPTMPPALLSDFIHHRSRAFKHVQFVPELSGLPAQDVSASPLAGLLALEFRNGLYSSSNRLFKRCLDLLGSGVASLLTVPALLVLALWVKLDSPGPVFHASERVGQHGRVFKCLKFRTMYTNAEERLQDLLGTDAAVREEYGLYHKLEHDPRVTKAGRVLRKYSLDELPQIFNVLNGTMSLVGPRPYLVRELADMGAYGETIFEAKPGITGYWQVSGRSTVTFRERLEMESHYVRNWSIWWDIVLFAQTPRAVLEKRGAR